MPHLLDPRVLLLAAAGVLAGCANYRLGDPAGLAFSTVYVEPVRNTSAAPQVQALLTAQIRSAFARDGRLVLAASPDQGDVTLAIVVADFRRDVAATRPDDPGLAQKFDLHLVAHCTLRDNRTGRTYFAERPISAARGLPLEEGLAAAEYHIFPILTELLAERITRTVLDVW
jgi:hypothetical protein